MLSHCEAVEPEYMVSYLNSLASIATSLKNNKVQPIKESLIQAISSSMISLLSKIIAYDFDVDRLGASKQDLMEIALMVDHRKPSIKGSLSLAQRLVQGLLRKGIIATKEQIECEDRRIFFRSVNLTSPQAASESGPFQRLALEVGPASPPIKPKAGAGAELLSPASDLSL